MTFFRIILNNKTNLQLTNRGSKFVGMEELILLILLITFLFYIGYDPKLYYERGNWILMYGRGKNRKTKVIKL